MIGDTLCKNTMTGRFFLRAVKALVMVTLSDSFWIRPPSTTLWRDFQKAVEKFAFPHMSNVGDRYMYIMCEGALHGPRKRAMKLFSARWQ